jgi:16S rRNA (adenine1518-N6/adenine1519-N6)-dimethyltransferase
MNKTEKVKYGQNFLINTEIAKKIVESCNFSINDNVVEIGSGEGILTELIAGKTKSFTIIEIDSFYISYMKGRLSLNKDLSIEEDRNAINFVNVDALKFDYIDLAKSLNSKLRVISNLPYEISSPIIEKFTKEKDAFSDFTLMFQKEFAKRLLAKPGGSERSALSVIIEANFEVKFLFDVDKFNFSPVPKVDSTVLKLTPVNVVLSPFFNYFVHQIFRFRRKMLKNSIYGSFFGIPPDIKEKMFMDCGIDLNNRPQELSLLQFIKLAKKYKDYLNL